MNYEITLGNDTEKFVFTYELNDNEPTKIWSSLTSNLTPKDLRSSLNPWRGIVSDYEKSVKSLNNLIDDLNLWVPEKISYKWDINEPLKSLNNLHIHFPNLEKIILESSKRDQLTRFNDLIHGLQMIISGFNNSEKLYLLLCCDNSPRVQINEEHFKFFNSEIKFGDLTLHYCHVGRHPLEIFLSNDLDCPKEQIIPQHYISSYHTLRFFDIPNCKEKFKKFYYDSKLEWPFNLEDNRLAFGYINLGKLITVNNIKYTDQGKIKSIVKACNKILSWQFC